VAIEQAFRVFTEEFDRIKPREHDLLRVDQIGPAVTSSGSFSGTRHA
jgi:hypothetical protein